MMMMNNNTTNNNRFKTAMCKHFEQNGVCPIGLKCHFAHGKDELRVPTKTNENQSKPWGGEQTQAGNGYKKARCKFFDQGNCRFGQSCNFAHGEQDLRSTPNSFKGSNAGSSPSIQSQVAQKQIQELGQSLEVYHAYNSEFLEQIRNANEMCQSGNAQDAASILYGIMSRSDRTREDIENYAVMTYKMQVLGDNLYQQLSGGAPQLGNMDTNQMGGNFHQDSSYSKHQSSRPVASFSGSGNFGGNWKEKYLGGGSAGNNYGQQQQKENHFGSLRF